jgi:predicted nucleic acid-binding protein
MVVVDASVVLRWFVEQEGHEQAVGWLRRFVIEPELLVGPDLLRFEVHGALARLTPKRDPAWARRSFERFDRFGLRTVSTDRKLFDRALSLSAELRIAGYDAVYIAHAEALGVPWLTADRRVLRRLGKDPRVQPLVR